MDSKIGASAAVPPQVYEDFVPTTDLVQEPDSDTLLLNLTGFKKEQVRVQLIKTGILKISGERPIGQNKRLRFQKEFPVSPNCDKAKISAKFENGILYVKQPKLITSADKNDQKKPTEEQSQPQAQKKEEETMKSDDQKTTTTTTTGELPKQESKIPSLENDKQTTEAKEFQEKPDAEKVDHGNKKSYDSKVENDGKMRSAAALAEKLKMPRKVMNMTLLAILVLGIGLYVSNMMNNSNNYQPEE